MRHIGTHRLGNPLVFQAVGQMPQRGLGGRDGLPGGQARDTRGLAQFSKRRLRIAAPGDPGHLGTDRGIGREPVVARERVPANHLQTMVLLIVDLRLDAISPQRLPARASQHLEQNRAHIAAGELDQVAGLVLIRRCGARIPVREVVLVGVCGLAPQSQHQQRGQERDPKGLQS